MWEQLAEPKPWVQNMVLCDFPASVWWWPFRSPLHKEIRILMGCAIWRYPGPTNFLESTACPHQQLLIPFSPSFALEVAGCLPGTQISSFPAKPAAIQWADLVWSEPLPSLSFLRYFSSALGYHTEFPDI